MYKAIIIDDEEMARVLLREMLTDHADTITVQGMYADLPSGIKAIRKLNPDLVFLDIDLPGHSGLELLDFFNDDEIDFSIIFVTAYNQYALQALNMSAVSYILKPIQADSLQNAISLFERNRNRNAYNVLKSNMAGNQPQKIGLTTLNTVTFEELSNILFFEADGSYTKVVLKNGNPIVVSKALKHFENMLADSSDFIRCHKSFIVNVRHISEYVKTDGGYLKVDKVHQVSISQDKVDTVLKMITNVI